MLILNNELVIAITGYKAIKLLSLINWKMNMIKIEVYCTNDTILQISGKYLYLVSINSLTLINLPLIESK